MTATDELRCLLDERGVKWKEWKDPNTTAWYDGSHAVRADEYDGQRELLVERVMTPEQAIAATLGRELQSDPVWVDPMWEQWFEGLRHDEIKTIGDAVEQLMYETIEHGGDMGPNGNTYCGVDEGEVLTLGFINDWIEKFEATLGNDGAAERGTCHITKRKGSWYCDGCGDEVGDDDPTSELFIDGNAVELWEFCPRCGRKVVDA